MSLYLKYRPNDFDTLVDQDFAKTTLKNAILNDKLVGAYLLCGPRGTGKTSTARILAKSMNCLTPINGNACNNCDICKAFNNGNLTDIIEIDAASNTGVDNVRDIITAANFAPNKSKYKVYIIDEVHMLSKGAFNALLKILEEPPTHVKFILATTEIHQVPETILSRCQRFDFKSISNDGIKSRLQFIANSENITIDEKSLDYIAKVSGGGLRNAISTFEQLVINSKILYENVEKNLSLVDLSKLEEFISKLENKDSTVVDDFQEIINSGTNVKVFFKNILLTIRDKLVIDLKQNKDISNLISILDILNKSYTDSKHNFDENLTFMIGISKIITSYTPHPSPLPMVEGIEKSPNPLIRGVEKEKKKEVIIEEKKQEVNVDDVFDIFGSDEPVNQNISQKVEVIDNSQAGVFDKDDFIAKLKGLGAKGALTMTVRGADCKINDNVLSIKSTTSIARTQLTNSDNLVMMKEALTIMLQKDDIEIRVV